MNRTIHGVVTLLSPMNVTEPGGKWRLNDNGFPTTGDVGKPLNRTVRQSFWVTQPNNNRSTIVDLPFFPSNGLRGRLRRLAQEEVESILNQPLTLDAFHGMSCGAVTGKPDGADFNVAYYNQAKTDAFTGMFGGGPRLLQSRYEVSDMIPIVDGLCSNAGGSFVIPEEFSPMAIPLWRETAENETGERMNRLTSFFHMTRVDDVMRHNLNSRLEDRIDNFAIQATAWKDHILKEKSKRDEDKESAVSRSSIASMSAMEGINTGTRLYFRLSIDPVATDAQVGLLMLAVARLFNKNKFGAVTRSGFGRVEPVLSYVEDGETKGAAFVRDTNTGMLSVANALDKYMTAWATYCGEVDSIKLRNNLETLYYRPIEKVKDDKKDKNGKKGASNDAAAH